MDVMKTEIDGVLVIAPKVFEDQRGFFMETFHRRRYAQAGIAADFCQDNLSFSCKKTLRGLHYQFPNGQAKLVQVLQGEILDVAVDIRRGSPTFGRPVTAALSDHNRRQMFIPKGFAHGFCVLSETALFLYKCSDFYASDCDRGVLWSDPALGIEWPVESPLLSRKDEALPHLKDIPLEQLPEYKEGQEGWEAGKQESSGLRAHSSKSFANLSEKGDGLAA
jgi:dTDP-4-dehydrorhamnose 3,5-epimerase